MFHKEEGLGSRQGRRASAKGNTFTDEECQKQTETACPSQEYFFPKEEDPAAGSAKKGGGQELWMKSALSRTLRRGGGSGRAAKGAAAAAVAANPALTEETLQALSESELSVSDVAAPAAELTSPGASKFPGLAEVGSDWLTEETLQAMSESELSVSDGGAPAMELTSPAGPSLLRGWVI